MSSPTKSELLRALFDKYGLRFDTENPESKDNDVYLHKHYKIITRSGIQKIERIAGIKCDFSIPSAGLEYCIVRGVGTLPDGTSYTTLASASALTSTNKYYAEMAEKRVRSRLVLTLVGLYQEGVFGEDEADDFKEVVHKRQAGVTVKTEFKREV